MTGGPDWTITPDSLIVDGVEMSVIKPGWETSLTVAAQDGAPLLCIVRTPDGKLDVTGPEDRWTEGAARFVAEVRRLLAESGG